MDLKLTGTIKVIMDTQTFDSGFSKREFVVTTQEQYPQDVKFEFLKDKTTALDNYNVGSNVNVHFNIRGNEYNSKFYVSLQAWKMSKAEGAPVPVAAPGDDEDDLPF